MIRLSDDDAIESVRFFGRRDSGSAVLFALRSRSTAPVDGIGGFVVLRVEKAVVGEQ